MDGFESCYFCENLVFLDTVEHSGYYCKITGQKYCCKDSNEHCCENYYYSWEEQESEKNNEYEGLTKQLRWSII